MAVEHQPQALQPLRGVTVRLAPGFVEAYQPVFLADLLHHPNGRPIRTADVPKRPARHGFDSRQLGDDATFLAGARELLGVVASLGGHHETLVQDRKSTRLNSSHVKISYAVFCSKTKPAD